MAEHRRLPLGVGFTHTANGARVVPGCVRRLGTSSAPGTYRLTLILKAFRCRMTPTASATVSPSWAAEGKVQPPPDDLNGALPFRNHAEVNPGAPRLLIHPL